jgi:hypothetical protein
MSCLLSVIVSYLHFRGASVSPHETETIPIVDADAVLPPSIPGKLLKPIARRYTKVSQDSHRVELIQLTLGHSPYRRRARPLRRSSGAPVENVFNAAILE